MVMWVTPSLAVAADEEALDPPFKADEVEAAVNWIRAGFDAYVVDEDTARAVLVKLGLSDVDIADRFRYAHTGEV